MERSQKTSLAQVNYSIAAMQPRIDELIANSDKITITKLILKVLSTPLEYEYMHDLKSKNIEGKDKCNSDLISKEKELLDDYNELKNMLYVLVCNNKISPYNLLKNFEKICKSIENIFPGTEDQNINDIDVELATDYELAFIEYKGCYSTAYLLYFYFDVLDTFRFIPSSAAESNHSIGKVYALRLNDYNMAIEYYKKAIKLNPAIPKFWIDTGKAFMKIEKYEESLGSFNHVVEAIDGNNIEALYGKALVLYNLNRFERAFDCCKEILRIYPLHDQTIILLKEIKKGLEKKC